MTIDEVNNILGRRSQKVATKPATKPTTDKAALKQRITETTKAVADAHKMANKLGAHKLATQTRDLHIKLSELQASLS